MSLPPDGFADEPQNGPPDGFADHPAQQGIMDQIGGAFRSAQNQVANTPMGMVAGMQDTIDTGARKLGDLTTSLAQKSGINASPLFSPSPSIPVGPTAAKILGKTVQYTPTAISMAATPTAEAGEAVESAKPLAMRALGFSKPMLKTPFARGQALKAGEVALENNIIPRSGNPEVALNNAMDLANKSGQKIGETLKSVPADVSSAMDSIENARQELTKGFSGGLFERANKVIDDVKSNLQELFDRQQGTPWKQGIIPEPGKPSQDVSASVLNQIKTRLARSINYMADLAAQSDNKTVVNSLANSIRDSVKSVLSPEDYADFIKNQKLFNTAELMKKGLNNEVAKQMGNHMFSPYSIIPAAGEIAAGNPGQALGALGIGEGIMRRGAGIGARAIQDIGTNAEGIGLAGAQAGRKILSHRNSHPSPLFSKRVFGD